MILQIDPDPLARRIDKSGTIIVSLGDILRIHGELWKAGRRDDMRIMERYSSVMLFKGLHAFEELFTTDLLFRADVLRLLNEFQRCIARIPPDG